MADRVRGITIEIGGDTSSLSKALSGINGDLKSTQAQLRDVERLLKLDPRNTRLLEQQQRLLAQSITNTSQKLEVLKNAETQVQQKFQEGKVSQEQYDALAREIVYTENALKKLNSRADENADMMKHVNDTLDQTSISTEKATEKIKGAADTSINLGDALYSIADAAGVAIPPALENMVGSLSNVSTKGFAVAGVVTGIATGLFSLASQSAKSAKEIENLAAKAGMSTTEFQEWDYVLKQFGSSAADMQGDIAGLAEKAMDAANGGEDAAEAFEKLGINVLDNKKQLKDQSTLFSEVISELQKMENSTERSAIATELLSTTGENLIPILQLSSEELEKMKQTAHDLGYVLEEETVKSMSDLDDQFSRIEDSAKNAGTNIVSFFSPVLGVITYLIEGASLFIDLITSGWDNDFERKLWDLNNRFKDFFKNVGGGNFWEALGMPRYASGTPYHPGGLALVGERGPELVKLPRGSSVYTHSETERILSGGGDNYYITVEARNIRELSDLVWMAQNARRDRRAR